MFTERRREGTASVTRTQDMTAGSPVRLILIFALPILAGNLLQQLYSLIDSLIIGQLLGDRHAHRPRHGRRISRPGI